MGKKGSWFSAIKRVFSHESKDKPSSYGSNKKSRKEKKATGKGILQHGETKSFIPRLREPSSIEKILDEADRLLVRPPESSTEAKIPRAASPPTASQRVSSARFSSFRAPSPKAVLPPALSTPEATQNRWEVRYVQRPETTPRNQHRSATIIQAAFRGYLARRNFRALRGLMRLQGVVRSPNAQRQTTNAMKQMQLLVRIQTQIQSTRIQMLEKQAIQHQAYKSNNELESHDFSKWTLNQLHEAGYSEGWDASLLTKEEIEARLKKKYEAVMKRERAMAYAYSHQLWKADPRSAHTPPDVRSNGLLPWWWNWLERQQPPPAATTDPPIQYTKKKITSTPPRPASTNKRVINSTAEYMSHEIATPVSTRATIKTPAYDFPLRDDESLETCPPFSSTPNYMTPTASAKAKARASSNPRERPILQAASENESKKRFSFSFTSNIGSLKWSKGSAAVQRAAEKKHDTSSHFIRGDLSVDSTVSMPAAVGRRPFNRFV